LNSLDDFNSKSDLGFYYYQDVNTGVLYIHVNVHNANILTTRTTRIDTDLQYTSDGYTFLNVPNRYSPPSAVPTSYNSLAAISPPVSPAPAPYDYGANGADASKYVSREVPTATTPTTPTTPNTPDKSSDGLTGSKDISASSRLSVGLFFIVMMMFFMN